MIVTIQLEQLELQQICLNSLIMDGDKAIAVYNKYSNWKHSAGIIQKNDKTVDYLFFCISFTFSTNVRNSSTLQAFSINGCLSNSSAEARFSG